ncbi:MAG: hypothetical protein EPO08_15215 [Rhodospirillaceae bacterium]|nr:MAG: hypothetical protein EPO08_15215 [Rhodospirillaceae bacterium]
MTKVIDTLLRLIAEIRAQIEARVGVQLVLTERAKIGIVTGGALAILMIWLGLNTWVGHIEHQYGDVRINLARLKAQVESGAWSERKSQSHILKSVLEDRLWTAETPGLAEAGFERWIRDHLANSRIEPQQIQIRRVPLVQSADAKSAGDATGDPLASVQRMTAKILMPFDENALVALLADIAESNKIMTVDRLVVRAGRNARVEMDVSTFFRYHERIR